MRPECAWSMSTVGLTAQEISFPTENPFLRGSFCHSMAGSTPSWNCPHKVHNFYFTMGSAHVDHSSHAQQQGPPHSSLSYDRQKHSPRTQRLPPKKSRPSLLSLPYSELSTLSPADKDQVVPSFQKLSVYECSSPPQTPDRCAKPLPPIPLQTEISPEQAMDSEVEFFNSSDESCCLVSDPCPKSSAFRDGVPSRRSFRDCGQINYAYLDGPISPQTPLQPQKQDKPHPQHDTRAQREKPPQEQPEPVERQQDKAQRTLRRSQSGPAGYFNKNPSLRLQYQKRHTHGTDKPKGPPPIPPRPIKTVDYRRWSAEVPYSDGAKPPKVPPREPLSRGSSRTPSPKSLPTYVNGVMPPTQSFAPDPKYCRVLQRQNSEGSPCILPIMEDGRKASTTHYVLLPQRSAFVDTSYAEKFLGVMESPSGRNAETSDSEWDC